MGDNSSAREAGWFDAGRLLGVPAPMIFLGFVIEIGPARGARA